MFIEDEDIEMADNVEETTEEVEEQPASPAETVDQTKAFAKRLKEETEKARKKEREDIAHSFGYESWEAYANAQTDNKLLDKGLDPESVRPVIKDLIKNDPEYITRLASLPENEKKAQEIAMKAVLPDATSFAVESLVPLLCLYVLLFSLFQFLRNVDVSIWLVQGRILKHHLLD